MCSGTFFKIVLPFWLFFFLSSVCVCDFLSAFICSCVEFQTAFLFKWCVNVKWLNFGLTEHFCHQWKQHWSGFWSPLFFFFRFLLRLFFNNNFFLLTKVKTTKFTGKNNGFPFLDILGYLKNTHKKSQIWQSETSPNQGIPNQVPWLGLVSLFQIWDFCGYSLNIPSNI